MATYWRINDGEMDDSYLGTGNISSLWDGEGWRECSCGGDPDCKECDGTGRVDDSTRRGVSVMSSYEALVGYFKGREADLDGTHIVELEGDISKDEDWDAADGALLVHPTQIISSEPVEDTYFAEDAGY